MQLIIRHFVFFDRVKQVSQPGKSIRRSLSPVFPQNPMTLSVVFPRNHPGIYRIGWHFAGKLNLRSMWDRGKTGLGAKSSKRSE